MARFRSPAVKHQVWRRSDPARNLAPGTATFLRETASRFARWYGLALLLQDERVPSRPILPRAQPGSVWHRRPLRHAPSGPHLFFEISQRLDEERTLLLMITIRT